MTRSIVRGLLAATVVFFGSASPAAAHLETPAGDIGVQESDREDIGDPVRPTDRGLRTAESKNTPIEGSEGRRPGGRCFSVLDGGPPSPCDF